LSKFLRKRSSFQYFFPPIFFPAKKIITKLAGAADARREKGSTIVIRVTGFVCERISQNVGQPVFCQNNYHKTCTVEKNSPIFYAALVIFQNQPKVNNRPTGKNSGHPGFVTPISKEEIRNNKGSRKKKKSMPPFFSLRCASLAFSARRGGVSAWKSRLVERAFCVV
jgi:hypothetical protein